MNQVDIVFVVLVYRNFADLKDLKESIQSNVDCTSKVVVVDAYYDDSTSSTIREYAKNNNYEYLLIENKGYGYGNNIGIKFAMEHFDFQYIVVCNPDTIIKTNISIKQLKRSGSCIAPRIITSRGKNQNPFWPYKSKLIELLMYLGYKHDLISLVYLGVLINKLYRLIFFIANRNSNLPRIYACHGSFLIMSKEIVSKNFKYDDEMFLFFEEAVHAYLMDCKNAPIIYDKNIKVYHKEDGSMSLVNFEEYPYLKQSYMYYYNEYNLNKTKER
ncbi:MAG: hypothetical protein Q4P09_07480 [Phascolarctobacterium sp.]|nr:hypothetical protein [Phascolarctobacterium sp.]